jgi:signal transduction histidine kinase
MFKVTLPALLSIRSDPDNLSWKNGGHRKEFPVFEITLILALAVIGWVAFKLYEITPESEETRKELQTLSVDYGQIAEIIQSSMNELDESYNRYSQSKDAGQIEVFQTRCHEFEQWLERQNIRWKPLANSPAGLSSSDQSSAVTNLQVQIQTQMLPLLASIENWFRTYKNASLYLMNNAGKPLSDERIAQREQALARSKSRLVGFSRQARMRGEATKLLLTSTQDQHGAMKGVFNNLRFALLIVLVGLSFLLMLAIYRRQLAQTRRILRQHNRKHLEQQANLDKLGHFGRLAQELAHEIKQPLTAITARAFTLQKLLPPGVDANKDVAIIRNELKRLDCIVKDFLEFARPADPRVGPFAAQDAIEEIRDLMELQLEQQQIRLLLDCEDSLELLGDAQQLKQVLINLVRNAADSLEGSGVITLRSRKAARMLHGVFTEAVILEVEDTGPGIPLHIQDKIFDPFFSTKKDGTGLGLAISAGIVDKQGGNLEFESEPGKGTVFRIVMPAATQSELHEQSSAH